MLILALKTDQPLSQVVLYNDNELIAEEKWEAHRQLAETIHQKIDQLLKDQKHDWADIEGVLCYKGPGSFTGLRIGLSVANATAYGVGAAVVSTQGHDWQTAGIKRLLAGEDEGAALPEYGAEVHITKQKR